MKVHVEELSPIERKLSIEVEQSRVAEELSRAYALLSRQVKIAGFRPGKVPRRILEQRFRRQVEEDVIQRVVERAYLDAIREHQVEAVSAPQVTNEDLKPDAPFTFEARVEVKPRIEPKDYRGLALKKTEVQVADAQVEAQIESLRQNLARIEPVEGRDTAQAGDLATVDFEATLEGKSFPGSQAQGVTLEVVPGELVESKCAALAAVRIGEKKELDYAFPPDYRVEEVKGKTAHFTLHLKALKTRIVPELDDEFAREAGVGVDSLAALKAKVREDLERSERAKADTEERNAIIRALVEANPFEVPSAMVERGIDVMLEGAIRAMARAGIDPRHLNLDFRSLREEMRPRAVQEVKGALLLEAIAEKESLQPTEEEIDKKIDALAEQAGQAASMLRKHFRNPDERRGLVSRLREEKAIEFLKAQARYS